ncbi:flagellar motor switch protein FliN [Gracilimonas mengyeensis]|uniref:Flagellar motor switch protein FliN n=1 Tax=Gracilimonas mengyeensis TaxID=1302730 RepID=A0A521EC69_9BACT|nr:flagellar motor switch protein FliN [Gracilimonas mengyeensis]SMO81505.1 flagellar motor switch protein FliN [Gracilimonas mengyeensis]
MNNYQEQLQKYLPDIEEFLTSLLLEETNIMVASFEETEAEVIPEQLQKTDIILFARDENAEMDFVAVLDEEWFGLLSSVMLGVEEKKFNEVTKDLLRKFSSELSATLKKKFDEEGEEHNFGAVEVYQLSQLPELMNHTMYHFAALEVEGLADDNVRAAFLIGDPEHVVVHEEPEEEVTNEEEDADGSLLHFEDEQEQENKEGTPQEVVSGKYINFEDFDDNTPSLENGDGNSMDLLKDVEMDVSVELGRIELPLGKVLQLAKGSVIELEKLAGEPVDILVNGQRIAHGEVVVIDEHFGVRISNLITTRQRLAKLS